MDVISCCDGGDCCDGDDCCWTGRRRAGAPSRPRSTAARTPAGMLTERLGRASTRSSWPCPTRPWWRDLVAGSGLTFEASGEHELRAFPAAGPSTQPRSTLRGRV